MSDGTTHLFANLWTGAAMNIAAISGGLPPEICVGVVVGGVCGSIISPDYDIKHSLPKKVGSTIPFWNAAWWPYYKLSKHRGMSHAPIVGTIIRIGILLCILSPAVALLWLFGVDLGYWEVYAAVFAAWCIQDLVHLAMDGVLFRWLK